MKRSLIILFAAVISMVAAADLLDDITSGKFKPNTPEVMVTLSDGEHYAVLQDGNILALSYRTGQVSDTLFNSVIADDAKRSTVEQLPEIEGFLLSQDDRYILLYGNSKGIFRRSFVAEYYLYDTRRHTLRPLSPQMPVRDPLFSPDGKYIAFVRDNNLFIHKVDYNTEVAVTTDGKQDTLYNGAADWLYEEEFGTTALYTFSPDSKTLAFIKLDDTEVPEYTWIEYLDENGHALSKPVEKRLRYPKAGQQNPKASLCLYDTYYKSVKTISLPEQEDSYLPRLRWTTQRESTDKQKEAPVAELAVLRLNRDQNKQEVFLVNPKSTLSRLLYKEECKTSWVDYDCFDQWQWLSDNSFIVVSDKGGYRQAYLYGSQGNEKQLLTKERRDVTAVYGYDEQTQTLFFQAATTALTRDVYAQNVKKGQLSRLTSNDGYHSAVFGKGYKYAVLHSQSVTDPGTWTVIDRKGTVLRTLLDNKDVMDSARAAGLPTKEFFSFVTERGDTLNGWMLRPASASLPAATLLMQYSGPASQQVLNRWRIDWEEYLAAQEGVLCVCVDPRGTNARGRDFRSLTYMNIGELEAEDQISAAEYLVRSGLADNKHIGIWGWSYGGYQTIRTLLNKQSPFVCGMAVAPVTDWRLYDSAYTERYMRRPQVNESGYDNASLMPMAENLNARLLLVHGLADDNVHVQNTMLLTEVLTAKGKQFEMQLYPDDNHFLRKRSNYSHLYQRLLTFLRSAL